MKTIHQSPRYLFSFLSLVTITCATAQQMSKPDPQMQAVLDELESLGGKPIPTLSAEEARKQPTPADAVKSLLKERGESTDPQEIGDVKDFEIPLEGHKINARAYQPKGEGPFPVIHYIHGGGWVIANIDTYDSSARALAKEANALVISTHYRQAPEHKFPAAHEDIIGAYKWILENADDMKGNTEKVAVVGESAGGNLAANISLAAARDGFKVPVHQVLVYPIASGDTDSESYQENAAAKPLSAELMKWFFDKTLASEADASDPRISLLEAEGLEKFPPTTIITAEIDPLRTEGKQLAEKLEAAGVSVTYRNFEGVTHEFFGMGAVVDKAKQAVDLAAKQLRQAFEGTTE